MSCAFILLLLHVRTLAAPSGEHGSAHSEADLVGKHRDGAEITMLECGVLNTNVSLCFGLILAGPSILGF